MIKQALVSIQPAPLEPSSKTRRHAAIRTVRLLSAIASPAPRPQSAHPWKPVRPLAREAQPEQGHCALPQHRRRTMQRDR